MSTELFIPKKIRIGFQKRDDTYTGKLAYVIYYDAKGKLRKETSWKSWRHDNIAPVEFDNKPQDGFVLNKGIQRYNWGHFSSNRSYIRIFDTRGIEFEITPENLIGLLTETTCSKRGIEGECVYAWHGKELVLLPCSSEDYAKAVAHTDRQGKKISARDLKPGCSYTTKKDEEVIYLGRFSWFSWDLYKKSSRISQKKHIFAKPTKWSGYGKKPQKGQHDFFPHDAGFLAELNNDDPVANYADLIDMFNGDIHSSVIEGWKTRLFKSTPAVFEREKEDKWCAFRCLKRHQFTEMDGDNVIFWKLVIVLSRRSEDKVAGYKLIKIGVLDTKKLKYDSHHDYDRYGYHSSNCEYTSDYGWSANSLLTEQEVTDRMSTFTEVDAILTSGKKLRLKDIYSIAIT